MRLTTLAAALAALIAGGATAQEFELSYASPNPATHPYSEADAEWIARIEEQTQGRVKITPYWARSLITSREGVDELEAGIADIAYVTPIYATSGYDLLRLTPAFFYGYSDPQHVLDVFLSLQEKYPEMQAEIEAVHVLAYNVGTPMHLILRDGPVETIEDMKGLRIRAANDYIGPLTAMGAEGVAMPMQETYPALQKGVVDGVIANYETLKSLSFGEVAKFYTEIPHSRGAYPSRAMNMDVWNSLPEDIRQVFDDNVEWLTQRNTELAIAAEEVGLEYGKELGVVFNTPGPEVQEAYAAHFAPNAEEVAATLDAMGLPGSAILADVRAAAPGN